MNSEYAHEVPVVGLLAPPDAVRAEVLRIAALAGIGVGIVSHEYELEQCVLQLVPEGGSVPRIKAAFHPNYAAYFEKPAQSLSLFEQSEELLEMFLAAGSTQRGRIVGVVGAHGSAGATVLASWLARTCAEEENVALIDCDPLSTGIDEGMGVRRSPGLRWEDLRGEAGSLLPLRLNSVLPLLGALRILSADERGSVPSSGTLGERAISALSQANPLCVVDLPRHSLLPGVAHSWLEWCDTLLVIGAANARGISALARARMLLPPDTQAIFIVRGSRAISHAMSLAEMTELPHVERFRNLRAFSEDLEHGVRIGDRNRSGSAADVRRIAGLCKER